MRRHAVAPAGGGDARARAGGRALVLLLALAPVDRAAADGPVDVRVTRGSDGCHVTGSFTAPVSRRVAWDVLSDYDHISRFVSSIVSSKVERGTDGRLRVDQVATAKLLFVRKRIHVRLDVTEQAPQWILFRDVLGRDFRAYEGTWEVVPDSAGARVVYTLMAEPKTIPKSMCRSMLKSAARELLQEVRAEMLRRTRTAR